VERPLISGDDADDPDPGVGDLVCVLKSLKLKVVSTGERLPLLICKGGKIGESGGGNLVFKGGNACQVWYNRVLSQIFLLYRVRFSGWE
jgi:hypothetical protein